MDIVKALANLLPTAVANNEILGGDYHLQDDSDGMGPRLMWHPQQAGMVRPTDEEIAAEVAKP